MSSMPRKGSFSLSACFRHQGGDREERSNLPLLGRIDRWEKDRSLFSMRDCLPLGPCRFKGFGCTFVEGLGKEGIPVPAGGFPSGQGMSFSVGRVLPVSTRTI